MTLKAIVETEKVKGGKEWGTGSFTVLCSFGKRVEGVDKSKGTEHGTLGNLGNTLTHSSG